MRRDGAAGCCETGSRFEKGVDVIVEISGQQVREGAHDRRADPAQSNDQITLSGTESGAARSDKEEHGKSQHSSKERTDPECGGNCNIACDLCKDPGEDFGRTDDDHDDAQYFEYCPVVRDLRIHLVCPPEARSKHDKDRIEFQPARDHQEGQEYPGKRIEVAEPSADADFTKARPNIVHQ